MATRAQLEEALRQADAAGNEADARALADALHNYKETPNVDETRAKFEAMPWYQKIPQAADDVVRKIANGATMGWADNIAGLANPGGTEAENAASMEAQQRGGSASTAAELLGSFLPAAKISQGVGAATKMAGPGIAHTIAREGLAGGAMGVGQTLSQTSNTDDLMAGGVQGLLGGAAGGAIGSTAGGFLNWAGKKMGFSPGAMVDEVVPPRTPAQSRKLVDDSYAKVDALGTRYDGADYMKKLQQTADELNNARIDPVFHPNASRMMGELQQSGMKGGDISPRSLDDLRRQINRDVTGSDGERHMAGILGRNIDDFIEKGATTTGQTAESAAEASRALRTARDTNRRMKTQEDVEQALFKGENSVSATGDVSALRSMLNNPNRTKGMSPEELAALTKVVRGSTMENVVRSTMGGIPIAPLTGGIVAGAATGNPAIGILAGSALGIAKPTGEKLARRYTDANIQALMNTIAGGHTVPSAARSALPVALQAGIGGDLEQDRKNKRRRRREMAY